MRKNIIYGWESTTGKQLFVYENKNGWGVTTDFRKAKKFSSVCDCNSDYLNRHSFPENYQYVIDEGGLAYFKTTGQRLIS